MTDPLTPNQEAADLTADDRRVEPTDNGLRDDDAALDQPPQDAGWLPEGTATEAGQ